MGEHLPQNIWGEHDHMPPMLPSEYSPKQQIVSCESGWVLPGSDLRDCFITLVQKYRKKLNFRWICPKHPDPLKTPGSGNESSIKFRSLANQSVTLIFKII